MKIYNNLRNSKNTCDKWWNNKHQHKKKSANPLSSLQHNCCFCLPVLSRTTGQFIICRLPYEITLSSAPLFNRYIQLSTMADTAARGKAALPRRLPRQRSPRLPLPTLPMGRWSLLPSLPWRTRRTPPYLPSRSTSSPITRLERNLSAHTLKLPSKGCRLWRSQAGQGFSRQRLLQTG